MENHCNCILSCRIIRSGGSVQNESYDKGGNLFRTVQNENHNMDVVGCVLDVINYRINYWLSYYFFN